MGISALWKKKAPGHLEPEASASTTSMQKLRPQESGVAMVMGQICIYSSQLYDPGHAPFFELTDPPPLFQDCHRGQEVTPVKHLALKKFTSTLKDAPLGPILWAYYMLGIISTEEKKHRSCPASSKYVDQWCKTVVNGFCTSSLPEPGRAMARQQVFLCLDSPFAGSVG